MPLIFRAVLIALLLGTVTTVRAGTESEVMVSVGYGAAAPSGLLLKPVGQDDKASQIEWTAERRGLRTSLFVGKLLPGRYELLGVRAAQYSVGGVVPTPIFVPVRPVDAAKAIFEVRADEAVDLGRVWVNSLGGNLNLLIHDPEAPANTTLHTLPANVPVATPWSNPPGAEEMDLLARAKGRSLVVTGPYELRSGEWLASTSNGEVLRRDRDGLWQIEAQGNNQLLASFDYLADGSFVVAGEFGQLVHKGAVIGQLPLGLPLHIHCSVELTCLAVLARENDYRLMRSTQLAAGQWQEMAVIPKSVSIWSGEAPVMIFRNGDETLLYPNKKELWRLTPTATAPQKEQLDASAPAMVVSAGRITTKGRYSDDGGRSWVKLKGRTNAGYTQFDGDGTAWSKGFVVEWYVPKLVLRRSDKDSGKWKTVAGMPADGALIVGRFSKLIYLSELYNSGLPWVSSDGGRSWARDTGLNPFARKH